MRNLKREGTERDKKYTSRNHLALMRRFMVDVGNVSGRAESLNVSSARQLEPGRVETQRGRGEGGERERP